MYGAVRLPWERSDAKENLRSSTATAACEREVLWRRSATACPDFRFARSQPRCYNCRFSARGNLYQGVDLAAGRLAVLARAQP
eukprot:6184665-Pleurochrysis_carterae.AAC.3